VNDPGYSLPMSTIAVIPIVISGNIYTYFDINEINGSNNFYYRIYNSNTGWGEPIDTGLDSTQYSYESGAAIYTNLGSGSNFFCAQFYDVDNNTYAVPFATTGGTLLETMTWNGATDNFSRLPNSFTSDVFFSYSSNSTSGMYDIQIYQPTTRLYQYSSIHTSTYSNNNEKLNDFKCNVAVSRIQLHGFGRSLHVHTNVWNFQFAHCWYHFFI
jgi:hypothetical protein